METKQKLYHLRRMLGWSQEALGDRIGLSQPQYGRLESGETYLKEETLKAIFDEWGITQAQFYSLEITQLCDIIQKNQGIAPPASST